MRQSLYLRCIGVLCVCIGGSKGLTADYGACNNVCGLLLLVEPSVNTPLGIVAADPDFDPAVDQKKLDNAWDEEGKPLFWVQQQQAVRPSCLFPPRNVDEIATLIAAARQDGCPFAVRGGGHSDIPGASNSDGGITVNMAGLSDVVVDEAAGVARVGAGAKWGDVYRELEKTNRTVVGGRLRDVGVGGLLFLPTVLPSTSPNLPIRTSYRALRGGGNNFGVVTRFDLDLYAQGPMWGRSARLAAAAFAHEAPSDPHVSLFAGLGYMQGNFAWAVGQYDALGREEPPIFARFRDDVETYGAQKIASTARVTSLSNLAEELNQSEPPGKRSRFTTATFKVDQALLQQMAAFYVEQVKKALDNGLEKDEGFAPMLGIQPLTRNILREQAKRGGNVMGLSEEDGPLMVCSFGWEWSHESDDGTVIAGIKAVLEQSVAAAKERGLYHPFKYMNYAAEDQDPIAGYGSDNVNFLKEVQQRYDPGGVFTKLVPGWFKVRP
ncbi:hypothetical protein PG994_003620 [Apiospora phragmitis]|uniref:FAD-binding PCMH-type domain-containing protein n=1 Tax=Apiospora phragmitis TaxID=2905665 RepID=A0ABR1VYQ0_9PEZI